VAGCSTNANELSLFHEMWEILDVDVGLPPSKEIT